MTCQAQPALGMVYKLVDINGVAKIKLSDEKEKTTLPGEKTVLRVYDDAGKPAFDLLCLQTEAEDIIGAQTLTVYETFATEPVIKDFKPSGVENLSVLLFENGHIVKSLESLPERRLECINEFKLFGGAATLLSEDDCHYKVYLSEKLNSLANALLDKYHR